MPHKHSRKIYIENGHYHIYNRGVEKRTIFEDDQDFRVFLKLIKHYLSPKTSDSKHPLEDLKNITLTRPQPLTNLHKEVDLLAYCLMPNHFHLLIKQTTRDGMPKFLQRLSSTYSMYFNKRYKRVGYLFQGRYKAVLITQDSYLLHLSRYIHLNPTQLKRPDPFSYSYSSYPYYLRKKRASWVKPNFILDYFSQTRNSSDLEKINSYKQFVENYKQDLKEHLGELTLEG